MTVVISVFYQKEMVLQKMTSQYTGN